MTKQDKRVCGVCLEHGHTSVDCPRRHGDMVMVSETLPDELRRLQAASAERARRTTQDKPQKRMCDGWAHVDMECYARLVEATTARGATASECTRCAALEAEVAELQGILAGNGPRLRVAELSDSRSERSDIVLSERISEQQPITERNTERISERKRGRPASPLTKAERQRAYRERRA